MKIASWNVNSLKVRLPQVLNLLKKHDLDILALQETKLADDVFPAAVFQEAGYQVAFSGQKTFNGVAIISKDMGRDVLNSFPDYPDLQRRVLAVTINSLRIINLYIPNGQSLDSPKCEYKLEWLIELTAFLHQQLKQYPYVLVMGDFNIAPQPEDVYAPQRWEHTVLFAPVMRQAFQNILMLGMHDAFRLFKQPADVYSWWHYRYLQAVRLNQGLRIDHILINTALIPACVRCFIDVEERQVERPSDHAPVVVELNQDLITLGT